MTTTVDRPWGNLAAKNERVAVNGQEIAVARFGDGPALVILHGIGSRATSWAPVAEHLAGSYEVIAIDHRGHGASSHPATGYLVDDYADDLTAVIDRLGLERPLVMGHSLGGMTTLEWARRHPERAAAIVLEDASMRRGGPGVEALFDGWITLSRMPVEEVRAHYAAENPGWSAADIARRAEAITSVAPGVFAELKANMLLQGGISVVPTYAGIISPVLLVYGDVETGGLVPGFDASAFGETVPNAELAHIAGGGHSLHRDSSEAFLAAVEPFLARFAPGASRYSG
jgi:pimeloyl-ACP methyl ester carboxylesterase